jgi:hypothetical protein
VVLRVSISEATGEEIDLDGITDPACNEIKGIPHSEVLMKFTNAFISNDTETLAEARDILVNEMGAAAMIDTAAVASNQQRMVRIADATGIPLESMGDEMDAMAEEMNEQLGINDYVSAANSK